MVPLSSSLNLFAIKKNSYSFTGVTNDELFGIINQTTREWKDGLFSALMRDQVNLRSHGPKWIVLDGKSNMTNSKLDKNETFAITPQETLIQCG